MAKNANFVSHKKSKQIVDGKPKLPLATDLVEGEIAINFGKDVETLSIKNESGDVVTFSSDNYFINEKSGFKRFVNPTASTNVGLVNSLSQYYDTNIGKGAVIEGDGYEYNGTIHNIVASGGFSHAEGQSTQASGACSHAEGAGTIASGNMSHAEGIGTIASITGSHAEGQGTTASGQFSHAEGQGTTASGSSSHAEGQGTMTIGSFSHAEGQGTQANGIYSHAEGYYTRASGNSSHAEGQGTQASGSSSHAEGQGTLASGACSHAEGQSTQANGIYSHAEGQMTTASGNSSHAEGQSTTANGGSSHAEGQMTTASGNSSHAEGYYTTASGNSSHAEGYSTQALGDYSHAEGNSSQASGACSHAEGYSTQASGACSHAEGVGTTASGTYSHAEGVGTTASGDYSHAEGSSSQAIGNNSHAEGYNTITYNKAEHASGQYNVSSSASTTFGDSGNTLFSVGNGISSTNKHNAFEIRQNGDIYIVSGGTDILLQDNLGGGSVIVDQVLDDTTSASTNPVSSKAVYKAVTDNELVWTNAFVALSGTVSAHTENTEIHVTAADKEKLHTHSNKAALDSITGNVGTMAYEDNASYSSATEVQTALSGKANTASTLSGYGIADAYTKSETSGKTEIENALNAKTDTGTTTALNNVVTAHTSNADIHVTTSDKTTWNAVTAKTDNSAFTAHTASTSHMTSTEKDNLDSLASNISIISGITSEKVGNWDNASNNAHNHSNKTILDNITAAYTTSEQTKLSGIANGAEVNQNTFSNIKVGVATISADSKTSTLEVVGDGIINVSADATNNKLTFSASNAVTSVAGKTGAVSLSNSDVGLGNVTNDTQVKRVEMGTPNGVATLGSDGRVPSSQLPSYVDDVLEYVSISQFPSTGESGKIYVDTSTNKTYRWGGTSYVEISASLALGETSSTAYYGDKGKIAYDHSQSTHARTDATAVSFTRNLTSGTKIGTITINGNNTDLYCETNTDTDTWRPITNTYTGSNTSTSVSQYGTNALYNALVNGYASEAGYASSAGNSSTVNGHTVNTDVPSGAVFTDTWRPLGTSATDACAGNDSRLSDARRASDVYDWAKASSKPSYSWSEIGSRPTALSQFTNDVGYITSYTDTWRPITNTYTGSDETTSVSQKGTNDLYNALVNGYASSAGYADSAGYANSAGSAPASDVYAWAKASSKPTYTKSEVGLGNVDNTADSQKSVNYANSAGYASSAGSAQPVFNNGTWYTVGDDVQIGDHNVSGGLGIMGSNGNTRLDFCQYGDASNYKSITFDGSTLYMNGNCDYASSAGYANSAGSAPASDVYAWAKAASKPSYSYSEISGAPSSLPASDVYPWAKAASKPSYNYSEVGAAASNHNHDGVYQPVGNYLTSHQTVTLASGTNNGTLKITTAAGTTDNVAVKGINSMAYQATSSYSSATQVNTALANKLDKTEYATFSAATNTSIEDLSGQSETIAAALNDLNERKLNASDVYDWAKAPTKPIYNIWEVMLIGNVSINSNTSSVCAIGGASNDGKAQTIIYINSGSSDVTVTVPTAYKTPDGAAIELTCPVGGYCEVSYLNIGGTIYARGL